MLVFFYFSNSLWDISVKLWTHFCVDFLYISRFLCELSLSVIGYMLAWREQCRGPVVDKAAWMILWSGSLLWGLLSALILLVGRHVGIHPIRTHTQLIPKGFLLRQLAETADGGIRGRRPLNWRSCECRWLLNWRSCECVFHVVCCSAATRCLNTMCDSHPSLVELLCSRYRSVALLVMLLSSSSLASTDLRQAIMFLP